MKQQKQGGITVFFSYAQADQKMRDRLAIHLSQLERDGLIETWSDQQILAGANRTQEIDQAFRRSRIILLLISADFLASDTCYTIEMQQALERHRRGEARVVPLIVRPCDWQHSPFAHLQCLPRNLQPVATWSNQDEAFLSVAQELRKIIALQQLPSPQLSSLERQNHTRLLQRVRATWIEGLLEHSLYHDACIHLHLQEQPDALANPWRLQVQELDHQPHPLPNGTSIVQVYDEADGELLLLGEPGSGKTTLLLQLARTLLDRSEADERLPLPVIFNLSSWAQRQEPLGTWLIEELKTKYQVPQQIAQRWIVANQILPLLDGLDEVAKEVRVACMQAVTAYYHQRLNQGGFSLVVCCRSEEYRALSLHLPLQRAISILPLTKEQIDDYLTQAGQQLDVVRWALHEDQELQELAKTPLMLSILALAYQGEAVGSFAMRLPPDVQRAHVLGRYVERMLQRRAVPRYPPEQTKRWLTWLARHMVQHNQMEFYLERMQPDWLEEHRSLRRFYRTAVQVNTGLLSGMVGVLLAGLDVMLVPGLVRTLLGVLVIGLLVGLLVGLTRLVEKEIKPAEVIRWSWKSMWQKLATMESLRSGLVAGLGCWLLFWLPSGGSNGLVAGLLFGLNAGLIIGLVSRRVSELPGSTQEMHLLPGLSQEIRGSLLRRVLVGLIIGLAGLWLFAPFFVLISRPTGGLTTGLLFGLIAGLVGGSGQEIRGSLQKRMLVGLVGGLVSGLLFGLVYGLIIGLAFGLVAGLITGLAFWLIGGLAGGLTIALTNQVRKEVQPRETVGWLRTSIWWGLLNGEALRFTLVSGLLVGLGSGLLFGLISGPLFGLISGLGNGLLFMLVAGLVSKTVSELLGSTQEMHLLPGSSQGTRDSLHKRVLTGLLVGLAGGGLFGLLFGLVAGLVGGLFFGLVGGLFFGLSDGLFFGLIGGLAGGSSQETRDFLHKRVLVGLVGGLVSGVLLWLILTVFTGLNDGLIDGLGEGLFGGLLGGLAGGLTIALTNQVRKEVQPREIVGWLRTSIWRGLLNGEALRFMLVSGLLVGLLVGLLIGQVDGLRAGLSGGLEAGLLSGFCFEFINGLIGGLSSDLLEKQILTRPNQGIQRSAQNSMFVGLLGGLGSGLVGGGLYGLIGGGVVGGLIIGMGFGIISGLSIGLSNGGAACIQHAVLRMFLWRAGYIPWNYVRFLDDAAERILLRKVGGGYIFVHRIVLEYFSTLDESMIVQFTSSENKIEKDAPGF